MQQVGEITVPLGEIYKSARQACKQSHNMSGLVCVDQNHCLMVADEGIGLHRLKIERRRDGPIVSHDAALRLAPPPGLDGHHVELDLESVARYAGKLFLVGSHANKRNKGTVNPHSHFVGVINEDDVLGDAEIIAEWTSLDTLIRKWLRLGSMLNAQLQCGGINIEGATVFDDRLLIGLRSPVRQGSDVQPAAYVISTPIAGVLGKDFSGAGLQKLPTLDPFIGIRDMETVGDAVLVVTGDAGVNDLDGGALPSCGANINRNAHYRPFQLRLWRPHKGDFMENGPLFDFPAKSERDCDGEMSLAKVEGIAKDPGAEHAYFVVYDGSPKIYYLKDRSLP